MALDLTVRGVICTLRWRRGRWQVLSGLREAPVTELK